MAYADLREFVRRLEEEGELVRISTPVSARLEITEITDRVSKGAAAQNKALLFENVEGSSFPVLINAFGSARRMALALGANDLEDLRDRLAKLIDPRLPQGLGPMVKRGSQFAGALRSIGLGPKRTRKAPCQDVIITDHPSLDILPLLTCWPDDGGPYVTLPQVITRDPVSHVRNVGMYRLQKYDNQTLGMHWQRHKGGAEHEQEARAHNQQRIPVAVALGGDPAQMWCASAPLPPNIDEYLMAGWLRRKPVSFVKCITQDIEAPANADIVIEGYIDLSERRSEGPFGDHTGFYTPPDLFPVMHVTAITHRADAIYPTTVVGKPPMEDYWMGKATERLFLPLMQLFMGEIRDVNMPAEGLFHNLVIVSIKSRFPGHAQKVMYGLWGLGLLMLAKGLLIVDEDVNVHDLQAVAEEVLRNVDWRRDITVVDGPVDQLDHSALLNSYGGKIGIDATSKAPPNQPDAPIHAEPLSQLLGGEKWAAWGNSLIIFEVNKKSQSARPLFTEIWKIQPEANLIALDTGIDLHDLSCVAWRTLGNVDWRRDLVLKDGPINHYAPVDGPRARFALDATSKGPEDGHPRGWPQEIEMSEEIKALVSKKWSEYGIGG